MKPLNLEQICQLSELKDQKYGFLVKKNNLMSISIVELKAQMNNNHLKFNKNSLGLFLSAFCVSSAEREKKR